MSYTDNEPSCTKCRYACWEITEDWESFDGRKEYDIVCNHPQTGNLGRLSQRDGIIDSWHDDTIEYAEKCGSFEMAIG